MATKRTGKPRGRPRKAKAPKPRARAEGRPGRSLTALTAIYWRSCKRRSNARGFRI
jgi:hypothetical protein